MLQVVLIVTVAEHRTTGDAAGALAAVAVCVEWLLLGGVSADFVHVLQGVGPSVFHGVAVMQLSAGVAVYVTCTVHCWAPLELVQFLSWWVGGLD